MTQTYGLYLFSHSDRIEVLDYTKSAVLLSIFRHSPLAIYHEHIGLATFRQFPSAVDMQLRNGQHFKFVAESFSRQVDIMKTSRYTWIWTENWISDLTLLDKTTR